MKVNISGDSAQEIFESVRELVSKDKLQSGDQLPSVRELAEYLKVNRNTVSAAYQRLTQAGIAMTQGRLGTRICPPSVPGEQEGISDTSLCDLADGGPRIDWLPDLNQVAQQTCLHQSQYGEATILPRIETYAREWFADQCPRDFDVAICNGAIDSLERVIAAHLLPGDKVVVEDPCYISSANAIRLAGLRLVGAAVDEQGMRPEALQHALEKGAKALLLTPRAHNPTGVNVSLARARALRNVLSKYPGVVVMEDDHFALMATTDHYSVIPDTTYHWAIFRSVSKGLGPDLRMAFLAADKVTVQRINSRLAPGMTWVSKALQALVYTSLTVSEFQQHLAIAKRDCKTRRSMLIDALTRQGISTFDNTDGLNVWVPVQQDSMAATYALSRKGWLVRPGSIFDIEDESQYVRVSIQKIEAEMVDTLALDIADVIGRNSLT